jgi:hypothetical protein
MKKPLLFPLFKTTPTDLMYRCTDITLRMSRTALFLGIFMLIGFLGNAQTTVTLGTSCKTCPTATLTGNAASPVPVPTPSCGTVAGTYKVGTALTSANTITLSLNVITAGPWSITTTATNGMTFTGSGTFAATGTQTAVLTGSGTPLMSGTTSILVQYGGTTCATTINVVSNAPTAAAPPVGAINGGSLGGKTCFDVAISNDNTNGCALLTSRTPQKSDFTLATTNQQVYTFTPRGTVSNVRFAYVNTNGNVITAITGGNTGNNITTPVTATASFNTGLNIPATGLTNANALTADIYVIYNDGATNNGTDHQLKITPKVKDCTCCGAWSFPNNDNTQPKVWLEFMCHNLGADETLDPLKFNINLYGDLFQWGRYADGHEKRNSRVMGSLGQAVTNTPNHDYFIDGYGDWKAGGSANRWGNSTYVAQSLTGLPTFLFNEPKGVTDPCPEGWKIPSISQWMSLSGKKTAATPFDSYGTIASPIANKITEEIDLNAPAAVLASLENKGTGLNFGDMLFLPYAGNRGGDGNFSQYYIINRPVNSLRYQATGAFYAGTTIYNTGLLTTISYPNNEINITYRANNKTIGQSVRCVIDK